MVVTAVRKLDWLLYRYYAFTCAGAPSRPSGAVLLYLAGEKIGEVVEKRRLVHPGSCRRLAWRRIGGRISPRGIMRRIFIRIAASRR